MCGPTCSECCYVCVGLHVVSVVMCGPTCSECCYVCVGLPVVSVVMYVWSYM